MDVRQSVLLLLLFLVLPGCRAAQMERELLERELRLQEDMIFDLEHELEEVYARLRSCECKVKESSDSSSGAASQAPRSPAPWPTRDALSPPSGAPSSPRPLPANPPRPNTPPQIDIPPGVDPNRPPVIELPSQTMTPPPFTGYPEIAPPGSVPEGVPAEPVSTPPAAPSSSAPPTDTSGMRTQPVADSPSAAVAGATFVSLASLTLDRNQTGGFDDDGVVGDDGILVVIEPRDAQGNVVSVAGDLAIVAVDPALEGAKARVARWDFRANEVPQYFRSTNVGSGIYLRLRWPDKPPANRQIMVFVRLTTADGNQFVAEHAIDLRLAGSDGSAASPQPSGAPQPMPSSEGGAALRPIPDPKLAPQANAAPRPASAANAPRPWVTRTPPGARPMPSQTPSQPSPTLYR